MKYTVSDSFPYYIELVGQANYIQLFSSKENFSFLETISEEKSTYCYDTGKWSIKQIIQHITDHERIMNYRILRISRKDFTPLAGYDHEMFAANGRADEMSWEHLLDDFKNVRRATISLINSISAEQLQYRGNIWKFEVTLEEYLKSTIGHELHHIQVIKNKYL